MNRKKTVDGSKPMSLAVFLLISIFLLVGCSSTTTHETSEKSKSTTKQLDTNVDGFELAEFERFNSPARDNGLGGTHIYFDGTVKNVLIDSTESIGLIITQSDGNEWFTEFGKEPAADMTKIESLVGKKIRVYGVYSGYVLGLEKPAIELYETDYSCGKCHIETLNTNNETYMFTDFLNDSDTMAAWCDENNKEFYAEDISMTENKTTICKTSGLIKNLDSEKNLLSIYTKKKDGTFDLWEVDASRTLAFYDDLDLSKFVNGESISLYYYIGKDNQPYFFAKRRALNLDFTMEDVNKQFQIETSSSDPTESLESETSETESETPSTDIVYEDANVIIKFLKVDSKGVHFDVENLTDKNITIQADSVSINGRSYNDITMSDDIAPHSIGEVLARCSVDDYREPVRTVGGQLRVVDFETWDSYNALIDNVVVNGRIEIEQPQPTGTLVFENKQVRIYYKEVSRQGVTFEVENLTGINLTIQADSISINKRSISDVVMSDAVAPHSLGEVFASCSPEYDGSVSTISGQLRIVDFDKWDSTNAKFVDVNLDKKESNDT